MRKLLLFLLILVSLSASSQYQPTSSKTKFVNGIGIGSKDTSQFTAADTIVLTIARDSVMYYRYRGFWRPIATGGNLSAYKLISDTLFANGYTTRARLKQGLDSLAATKGTVNSVGLTMPSAFNVANSPITTSGTLAVTAAGNATQYIRGDGVLANLPTSGEGGGASVSYYLNGSVNQGTLGGVTYYEMNKTPIIGAGTDFTRSSNGYIASFLTDANDPALLVIPAGNWNFETYFQASSGGGSPTFYIELYKYDGTTFTLIASNSTSPKLINDGTTIEAYFSALAVPQTTLTLMDRLAVRIYVTTAGRTITLHTENGHLCQVITTFTTGLTALNGLTAQVQYFATGTSGTDFNIASATATHTFNLPTASATNRGALSSGDWSVFNAKQNALTNPITGTGTSGQVAYFNGTSSLTSESNLFWDATNDRLGIGGTPGAFNLDVNGTARVQGNTQITGSLSIGSTTTGLNPFLQINSSSRADIVLRTGGTNDNAFSIYAVGGAFGSNYAEFGTNNGINAGSQGGAIYTDSRTGVAPPIRFAVKGTGTTAMTIAGGIQSNGNWGIGTTTDAGFRLDVNGTARVQGNTQIVGDLSVPSGNYISVNGTGGIFGLRIQSSLLNVTAGNTNLAAFDQSLGSGALSLRGSANNNVSGNFIQLQVGNTASSALTSNAGTANYTAVNITSGYNITGGTHNIIGIYYDPTLTSMTGVTHRAIQTVTGDVLLCTTSGNVAIGTSTLATATELTLGGSQTASSAIARGGLINTTLVASANNDVLVGLDINPTFTNGAFTGVRNASLRVQTGNVLLNSTSGNTLIGTTTDNGARLQVAGSGTFSGTSLKLGTQSDIVSTTGLLLGNDASTIEMIASTFGNGYGAKIEQADPGDGFTYTRLFGRANTTSWTQNLSINNSTGAATFSSTLGINGVADNVKGGTYTPTIANSVGTSSNSVISATYQRIGNIVTVYFIITGSATIDQQNSVTLTIPFGGNFSSYSQASGSAASATSINAFYNTANITAVSGASTVKVTWWQSPSYGTNQSWTGSFQYQVQ
jgi:hypothetical protein